ncbi:MAG: hypothetical protein V1736_09835 [Pseudomonadota bacterium]
MTEQKDSDVRSIFNPALFWDAGEIDLEKHAGYVIKRILEFGDEKDLKALRRIYADEKIIQIVKYSRGLSPRTRRFWCVYFRVSFKDPVCLNT